MIFNKKDAIDLMILRIKSDILIDSVTDEKKMIENRMFNVQIPLFNDCC